MTHPAASLRRPEFRRGPETEDDHAAVADLKRKRAALLAARRMSTPHGVEVERVRAHARLSLLVQATAADALRRPVKVCTAAPQRPGAAIPVDQKRGVGGKSGGRPPSCSKATFRLAASMVLIRGRLPRRAW